MVFGHIPNAVIEAMRRAADAWSDSANKLVLVLRELEESEARALRAATNGVVADALREDYKNLKASTQQLIDHCNSMAKRLYEGANAFELEMYMVKGIACVLAAQLLVDLAFGVAGVPAATAHRITADAGMKAAWSQLVFGMRQLMSRFAAESPMLAMTIRGATRGAVIGGLSMGGVRAVAESIQVAHGHREAVDWHAVKLGAEAGAIGGAVGGGLGSVVAPAVTGLGANAASKAAQNTWRVAGVMAAGVSGGAAGGLAAGMWTGGNLADAVLMGIGGGLLGGVGAGFRAVRTAGHNPAASAGDGGSRAGRELRLNQRRVSEPVTEADEGQVARPDGLTPEMMAAGKEAEAAVAHDLTPENIASMKPQQARAANEFMNNRAEPPAGARRFEPIDKATLQQRADAEARAELDKLNLGEMKLPPNAEGRPPGPGTPPAMLGHGNVHGPQIVSPHPSPPSGGAQSPPGARNATDTVFAPAEGQVSRPTAAPGQVITPEGAVRTSQETPGPGAGADTPTHQRPVAEATPQEPGVRVENEGKVVGSPDEAGGVSTADEVAAPATEPGTAAESTSTHDNSVAQTGQDAPGTTVDRAHGDSPPADDGGGGFVPAHEAGAGQRNCVPEAASYIKEKTENGAIDLSAIGDRPAGSKGVSGDQAARALRGDWLTYSSPQALVEHAQRTNGSIFGGVQFKDAGAHAFAVGKNAQGHIEVHEQVGNIVRRISGNEVVEWRVDTQGRQVGEKTTTRVENAVGRWLRDLTSHVESTHGIAFKADGTAVLPLEPGQAPRGHGPKDLMGYRSDSGATVLDRPVDTPVRNKGAPIDPDAQAAFEAAFARDLAKLFDEGITEVAPPVAPSPAPEANGQGARANSPDVGAADAPAPTSHSVPEGNDLAPQPGRPTAPDATPSASHGPVVDANNPATIPKATDHPLAGVAAEPNSPAAQADPTMTGSDHAPPKPKLDHGADQPTPSSAVPESTPPQSPRPTSETIGPAAQATPQHPAADTNGPTATPKTVPDHTPVPPVPDTPNPIAQATPRTVPEHTPAQQAHPASNATDPAPKAGTPLAATNQSAAQSFTPMPVSDLGPPITNRPQLGSEALEATPNLLGAMNTRPDLDEEEPEEFVQPDPLTFPGPHPGSVPNTYVRPVPNFPETLPQDYTFPKPDYVPLPGVPEPPEDERPEDITPLIPHLPAQSPANLPAKPAPMISPFNVPDELEEPNSPVSPWTGTKPPLEVTPPAHSQDPLLSPRLPATTETPLESPRPSRYATPPDPRTPGAPVPPMSTPPGPNPDSRGEIPDISGVPRIEGPPPLQRTAPDKEVKKGRLSPSVRLTMGEDPDGRRKRKPKKQPKPPIAPPDSAAPPTPAVTPTESKPAKQEQQKHQIPGQPPAEPGEAAQPDESAKSGFLQWIRGKAPRNPQLAEQFLASGLSSGFGNAWTSGISVVLVQADNGSTAMLGGVAAATQVATLGANLIAGPLSQLDNRKVLEALSGAGLLTMLGSGAWVLFDWNGAAWAIAGAMVLTAATDSIVGTISPVFGQQVARNDEEKADATNYSLMERAYASAGGKAAGPFIVGIAPVASFAVNGISKLVNIIVLHYLPSAPPLKADEKASFTDGFRDIVHDPFLLGHLIMSGPAIFANTLGGVQLTKAFVDNNFSAGAMGLVVSGIGTGLILAGFVPDKFAKAMNVKITYPVSLLSLAVSMATLGVSNDPLNLYLSMVAVGAANMFSNKGYARLRNAVVPAPALGGAITTLNIVGTIGGVAAGVAATPMLANLSSLTIGAIDASIFGLTAIAASVLGIATRNHKHEPRPRVDGSTEHPAAEPLPPAVIRNCAIQVARVFRALGDDSSPEPDDTDPKWDADDNWNPLEAVLRTQLRAQSGNANDTLDTAIETVRNRTNGIDTLVAAVDGHTYIIWNVEGKNGDDQIFIYDSDANAARSTKSANGITKHHIDSPIDKPDINTPHIRNIDGDENGQNKWRRPNYSKGTTLYLAYFTNQNGTPTTLPEPPRTRAHSRHPKKLLSHPAGDPNNHESTQPTATNQPPNPLPIANESTTQPHRGADAEIIDHPVEPIVARHEGEHEQGGKSDPRDTPDGPSGSRSEVPTTGRRLIHPPDPAAGPVEEILARTEVGAEAMNGLWKVGAGIQFTNDPGATDSINLRNMTFVIQTHDRSQAEQASTIVGFNALAVAVSAGQLELQPARIRGTDLADYLQSQRLAKAFVLGARAEFDREWTAQGFDPPRTSLGESLENALDGEQKAAYFAAYDAAVGAARQQDSTIEPALLRRIGREAGVIELMSSEWFDGDSREHSREWERWQTNDATDVEYVPPTTESARQLERLVREHKAAQRALLRINEEFDRLRQRVYDHLAVDLPRAYQLLEYEGQSVEDRKAWFELNLLADGMARRAAAEADLARVETAITTNIWHERVDAEVVASGGRWITDQVAIVDGPSPQMLVLDSNDVAANIQAALDADPNIPPTIELGQSPPHVMGFSVQESGGVVARVRTTDLAEELVEAMWSEPSPTFRPDATWGAGQLAKAAATAVDNAWRELDRNDIGRKSRGILQRRDVGIQFSTDPAATVALDTAGGRVIRGRFAGYDPVSNSVVLQYGLDPAEHASELVWAASVIERLHPATGNSLERLTALRDDYVNQMLDVQALAHARAFEFDRLRLDGHHRNLGRESLLSLAYHDAFTAARQIAERAYHQNPTAVANMIGAAARRIAKRGYRQHQEIVATMVDAAAHQAGIRAVRAKLIEAGPLVGGVDYATHYRAEWDSAHGFEPAEGEALPVRPKETLAMWEKLTDQFVMEIETLPMLRESGRFVPEGSAEIAYNRAYENAAGGSGTGAEQAAAKAGRKAVRKYLGNVGFEAAEIAFDVVRHAGDNVGTYRPWPDDAPALPDADPGSGLPTDTPKPAAMSEAAASELASRAIADLMQRNPGGTLLPGHVAEFPDNYLEGPHGRGRKLLVVAATEGRHMDALLTLAASPPIDPEADRIDFPEVLWGSQYRIEYLLVEPGLEGLYDVSPIESAAAEGLYRRPTAEEAPLEMLRIWAGYRLETDPTKPRTDLGFDDWLRQLGPDCFFTLTDSAGLEDRLGELRPDFTVRGFKTVKADPAVTAPHPAEAAYRLHIRQVPLPPPADEAANSVESRRFPQFKKEFVRTSTAIFQVDLKAVGNAWQVAAPLGNNHPADVMARLFQGMADTHVERLLERLQEKLVDGSADLRDLSPPKSRLQQFTDRLTRTEKATPESSGNDRTAKQLGGGSAGGSQPPGVESLFGFDLVEALDLPAQKNSRSAKAQPWLGFMVDPQTGAGWGAPSNDHGPNRNAVVPGEPVTNDELVMGNTRYASVATPSPAEPQQNGRSPWALRGAPSQKAARSPGPTGKAQDQGETRAYSAVDRGGAPQDPSKSSPWRRRGPAPTEPAPTNRAPLEQSKVPPTPSGPWWAPAPEESGLAEHAPKPTHLGPPELMETIELPHSLMVVGPDTVRAAAPQAPRPRGAMPPAPIDIANVTDRPLSRTPDLDLSVAPGSELKKQRSGTPNPWIFTRLGPGDAKHPATPGADHTQRDAAEQEPAAAGSAPEGDAATAVEQGDRSPALIEAERLFAEAEQVLAEAAERLDRNPKQAEAMRAYAEAARGLAEAAEPVLVNTPGGEYALMPKAEPGELSGRAWSESPERHAWELRWIAARSARIGALAAFTGAALEAEALMGLSNTSEGPRLIVQYRERLPGKPVPIWKWVTMRAGSPQQSGGSDSTSRATVIGRPCRSLSLDEILQSLYAALIAARPLLDLDHKLMGPPMITLAERDVWATIPRDGEFGLHFPLCRLQTNLTPPYMRSRLYSDLALDINGSERGYEYLMTDVAERYLSNHAYELLEAYDAGPQTGENRIGRWFTSVVAQMMTAPSDAAPALLHHALQEQVLLDVDTLSPEDQMVQRFASIVHELMDGHYDIGSYLRHRRLPEAQAFIDDVRAAVSKRHPPGAVEQVPVIWTLIQPSSADTATNRPGEPAPSAPESAADIESGK